MSQCIMSTGNTTTGNTQAKGLLHQSFAKGKGVVVRRGLDAGRSRRHALRQEGQGTGSPLQGCEAGARWQ